MRISDWSSDVCSSDLQLRGKSIGYSGRAARLLAERVAWRRRWPEPAGQIAFGYEHRSPPDIGIGQSHRSWNRFGCGSAYQRRSEEHTSELQSLMRISYAVFCLKQKQVAHTTTLKTNQTH